MRSSHVWAAAAVALAVTVAACSSGSESPTVASVSSQSTVTTAPAEPSTSTAQTPLAQAQAYSQCMRSNGVPNFPDPQLTPSGDYGYRTNGIDGESAAFQEALEACKDLPSPWNSTGDKLSPDEQQAWLRWAQCIRANGVPDFPDPTFGDGGEVQISDAGPSGRRSPQLQSAMDACKSQMPSTGGFGG